MKKLIAALALGLAASAPVQAADKLKLGLITTLSGPIGAIGLEQQRTVDLAIKDLGGKIGGLPVELIVADDQNKPDVAVQTAVRFTKSDKPDIVIGPTASNVLLAAAPIMTRGGIFVISANAGPSPLAGASCNENLFVVSWQNDALDEAAGAYMTRKGVKKTYIHAVNVQAGLDHVAGFKREYKGEVVKEQFTPLNATDFSVDLTSFAASDATGLFFFQPGALGINFIKQLALANVDKTRAIVTHYNSVDSLTAPAVGDAVYGIEAAGHWFPSLDNPANAKFVASFKAAYGRIPSAFAQQAYDAILLIDSAVRATGGKVEDKDAFRAALRRADFASTRGPFRFNNNHFPIQSYYAGRIVKGPDGQPTEKIAVVLADHKDPFGKSCKMSW